MAFQLVLIILIVLGSDAPAGEAVINYSGQDGVLEAGNQVSVFEDVSNRMSFEEVRQKALFQPSGQKVLNLGLSRSTFWIRFSILNRSTDELILQLGQPNIKEVSLYIPRPDGSVHVEEIGHDIPFHSRRYLHQNPTFDLEVPYGEQRTFFLKIQHSAQLSFPVRIGDPAGVYSWLLQKDLILGLMFGIFISMLLYNLFLYISVKDFNYIIYTIYILLVIFSQGSLEGYTFRYLWPESAWLAEHAVFIFPNLTSVAAIYFTRSFLLSRRYAPRLDMTLKILTFLFVLSLILLVFDLHILSFSLLQGNTLLSALVILATAIYVYRKGYNPAKYFLLAWSAVLLGAVTLVFRDFGLIPANYLTSHALVFGSAVEAVLLSFALADKINLLSREKEASQQKAMAAMAEITRIEREQNIILETKVQERTLALKQSNEELNKALTELKETESQLIETEKMASLGQLTAGIAHEINNPINFVAANVGPLKRDVSSLMELLAELEKTVAAPVGAEEKQELIRQLKARFEYDYLKEEIGNLIGGIKEGSGRIIEIIKGLRNFSRVDEDQVKSASIAEGIDSTLVIVSHMLDEGIHIHRDYRDIPPIECNPGKLNQVFLNIVTNGIQAIKSKFRNEPGGELSISARQENGMVHIAFRDNGTGMDEHTRSRIFEPFFTTKGVNEGTGLGMSIVYNIIQKHRGKIEIDTQPGVGTEFLIKLPLIQQGSEQRAKN